MSGHGDLSLKQAQRIAVAAQGLHAPRQQSASSKRQILRAYQQIGQTQVDSVNVVCRAHYQPLFARLGDYRTADLDALVGTPYSGVTEYWGHEASFVRSELVADLKRWRRNLWADKSERFDQEQHSLVHRVREYLQENPGSSAREISAALEVPANTGGTGWGWNWNDTKLVTEALFGQAQILSLGRNRQFERRFALAEQVVDSHDLEPRHDREESLHRLVKAAAGSLGIAAEHSLAEYYRLPRLPVRDMVRQMCHAGELEQLSVPHHEAPLYMLTDTPIPQRISKVARILSPFDSMVFDRKRLEELFGFYYRIEIYVPEAKRRYGYYVFPILWGHEFIGRVDLKADRKARVLRVQSIHFERQPSEAWLKATEDELWRMASWLELETVRIGTEQLLCTAWALAANAKPKAEMSM